MVSKDRWQRRKKVDLATLWSALQHLTAAVKHLENTAKDAAERHAAEIASLREQLNLCHREATSEIKADSALTRKVEKEPCSSGAAATRRDEPAGTGPKEFYTGSPRASPPSMSPQSRSGSGSPDGNVSQDSEGFPIATRMVSMVPEEVHEDSLQMCLLKRFLAENPQRREDGGSSATTSPGTANLTPEDGSRAAKKTFLPSELWPLLLEFLPVNEVVTMEIRAVSHFFANSKVWVAHLFKLMDLDSLPEHCAGDGRHPGLEFAKYEDAILKMTWEGAEEAKRNGSEGFQGYRFWINGLFAWHKRHPEMSFHFLQMAMQWFGSKQLKLAIAAISLCCSVRSQGIPDVTLYFGNSLLAALHADMHPEVRSAVIHMLKNCQAIYPHFNVELVLEFLESAMSWEGRAVRSKARSIAAFMLEAIVTDDEAFVLANRQITIAELSDTWGNVDKAAAKQQKLIGLLRERKCAAG